MWPITGSMAERRRSSRLMRRTRRASAGDEDAVWVRRIVAAVSLVDIGTLDLAAGEPFGVLDSRAQRVSIIRIARERLGVQHELAAGRRALVVTTETLTAELIGRAGLALADAFDLRGMEGIQLPAALALLLRTDLGGARERPSKRRFAFRLAAILRRMSRMMRPSRVRRMRNCRRWRLNCLAWA